MAPVNRRNTKEVKFLSLRDSADPVASPRLRVRCAASRRHGKKVRGHLPPTGPTADSMAVGVEGGRERGGSSAEACPGSGFSGDTVFDFPNCQVKLAMRGRSSRRTSPEFRRLLRQMHRVSSRPSTPLEKHQFFLILILRCATACGLHDFLWHQRHIWWGRCSRVLSRSAS